MDSFKQHGNTLLAFKPSRRIQIQKRQTKTFYLLPSLRKSSWSRNIWATFWLDAKSEPNLHVLLTRQTSPRSPLSKTCLNIISKQVIHTWHFLQIYIAVAQHHSFSWSVAKLLKNFIGLPLPRPRPGWCQLCGWLLADWSWEPVEFSKEHLDPRSAQGWHPSYLDWGRKHSVRVFLRFSRSRFIILSSHPRGSGWLSTCQIDVELLLVNVKSWKQSKTQCTVACSSSLELPRSNVETLFSDPGNQPPLLLLILTTHLFDSHTSAFIHLFHSSLELFWMEIWLIFLIFS